MQTWKLIHKCLCVNMTKMVCSCLKLIKTFPVQVIYHVVNQKEGGRLIWKGMISCGGCLVSHFYYPIKSYKGSTRKQWKSSKISNLNQIYQLKNCELTEPTSLQTGQFYISIQRFEMQHCRSSLELPTSQYHSNAPSLKW